MTGRELGRPERNETEAQRLDRNMGELLQELRVAQTGVQILFAFLLTLAFQQRFADVDAFGRWVYICALICALLSSGFLIAPVGYHRLVFRRAMKEEVVRTSNKFALAGLAFLSVALGGALTVILDVMFSQEVAMAGGIVSLGFLVVLWFLIPWVRVRAKRGDSGAEGH
ncbi:hypothetical protein FL583_28280 [Cryptosporangium phraense]|uniref:Sodium:proton antiporter n=2 Tax=Cryptosporangium phraense TaxID=2593070 RepID=A0A545AKG1_9ACTN|nr:hypothetical protein FL583_28280 [Cryptosporangium phraense]